MKTIGLIDYYISEWHANNYPAWIKEQSEKYGLDYKIAYAWAEMDVSPLDGKSTSKWCEEKGIEQCSSIEELCIKSDNVIILAPSNPETHLRLAHEVFRFAKGKRIYIDKTFAPDYETSVKIFDEAKENGVEFFSTSALRYADELKDLRNVQKTETFGGGSNFDEYIIHQIEMIVRIMGIDVDKIKAEENDGVVSTEIIYLDGRKARMNFYCDYGFKVIIDEKTELKIESDFFRTLMIKILRFFSTGEIDFSSDETLTVMNIREKAIKAHQNIGKWQTLKRD